MDRENFFFLEGEGAIEEGLETLASKFSVVYAFSINK